MKTQATPEPRPGIYVHLPFCKVHCAYCDFPLTLRKTLAGDYYESLLREIDQNPAPEADTLYFGGGTPSQTPVEVLQEIRSRMKLKGDSEVTIEANPDDITPQLLQEWKAIGITRISIGVQSLEREALQAALRPHTPEQAVDTLKQALNAGFHSINADMIIGLPSQTTAGFESDIDRLIALHPQHFSLYLLEVHESTALHKQLNAGRRELMAEEDQIACYRKATKKLQDAGYLHYEVSNFALPGFESRHNLKYWTSAPYYAYGAGACSYHRLLQNPQYNFHSRIHTRDEVGNLPHRGVHDRGFGHEDAKCVDLWPSPAWWGPYKRLCDCIWGQSAHALPGSRFPGFRRASRGRSRMHPPYFRWDADVQRGSERTRMSLTSGKRQFASNMTTVILCACLQDKSRMSRRAQWPHLSGPER